MYTSIITSIIYDASVEVASNYKDGMPGSLRVAQFDRGSSIIEISTPGMHAQIHAHSGELREFAAKLIEAADAFDAAGAVPAEVAA